QSSVSDPLGSRTSRTSHSGPEPPPFDRPPLISRTSPSSDSSRATQSTVSRSGQTSQSDQAGRSDQAGYDNRGYSAGTQPGSQPDGSRGRNDRPELQRSPDLGPARPAGSSDRGRPPVMHHRTDDQSENDSAQPAPQQQRNQQSGQQSGGKDEAIRLDATLVNLPLLV